MISLVGYEIGQLDWLIGIIKWENLYISADGIQIQEDGWRQNIQKRYSEERTTEILGLFHKWNEKVRLSEYNVVRWLCRGHIGFSFIWKALICCVKAHGENVERVLGIEEILRLKLCIRRWSENLANGAAQFPREVLDMLELSL